MSRQSSSRSEIGPAEAEVRRAAAAVGRFIGRRLAVGCYDFISAFSGGTRWRAIIFETRRGDVPAFRPLDDVLLGVPSFGAREDAAAGLLGHCYGIFGVDSVEELELKLAVLGRPAVESMLGIRRA